MSQPMPGAHTYKNWSLTVDSVDVSNQITKAMLKPTRSIQTLKAAVPGAVQQDVGVPVYTLDLTGVQNNTASTGLAAILRANAGTEVECVWVPNKVNGEVQATFNVVAMEMELGGETDGWNTSDISLPVSGQPVYSTYTE